MKKTVLALVISLFAGIYLGQAWWPQNQLNAKPLGIGCSQPQLIAKVRSGHIQYGPLGQGHINISAEGGDPGSLTWKTDGTVSVNHVTDTYTDLYVEGANVGRFITRSQLLVTLCGYQSHG